MAPSNAYFVFPFYLSVIFDRPVNPARYVDSDGPDNFGSLIRTSAKHLPKGRTMRADTENYRIKTEKFHDSRKLRVLLVGENVLGSSYLVNRLWLRGCQCEFAISYEEVLALLGGQTIHLMLCPLRLNRRNLLPLTDLLEGSGISLFYATSGDPGSWWLPALRHGRKCFGSFAISPSEFMPLLEEVLERAGRIAAPH
jgi:hypothetical protein